MCVGTAIVKMAFMVLVSPPIGVCRYTRVPLFNVLLPNLPFPLDKSAAKWVRPLWEWFTLCRLMPSMQGTFRSRRNVPLVDQKAFFAIG